jgi:hypothetical protein
MLAAVAAMAVLASGCGIRDPYAGKPSASEQSRPTTTSTSTAPTPSRPAASSGSAQSVLQDFALAYGDITPTTMPQRLQRLLALATTTYAARLERRERQAALQAVRGLPAGARSVALLGSIHLGQIRRGREPATVILQEAIAPAGGGIGPAVNVTYMAQLERTAVGWRVSEFTAEQ